MTEDPGDGAHQGYPVIGPGIAFTGIGAVALFGGAAALASARHAREVTVPETAASLTEPGLRVQK